MVDRGTVNVGSLLLIRLHYCGWANSVRLVTKRKGGRGDTGKRKGGGDERGGEAVFARSSLICSFFLAEG